MIDERTELPSLVYSVHKEKYCHAKFKGYAVKICYQLNLSTVYGFYTVFLS